MTASAASAAPSNLRAAKLRTLGLRYEMLFRYQEKAYEDKLNGEIEDRVWRERNEKWRLEKEEIENRLKMDAVQFDERIEVGVSLIELLQGAETTWQNASKQTKANMVKILVSNLTLKNGSLRFDWKKPFDLLAKVDSQENWWRVREVAPEFLLHISKLDVDYLTSVVLGCGEKAFYRAVLKLQLLGLINFERKGKNGPKRKRPNHYTFNSDPSLWRLPKELADEIRLDYAKLGRGDLIFKSTPFNHEFGFKLYFNTKYPNYQIQAKNRSMSKLTGTPVRAEIDPKDQPWFELLSEIIDHELSARRILIEFYRHKMEIRSIAIGKPMGLNQKKYLIELRDKYMQITVAPPNEEAAKLVAIAKELEDNGATRSEIILALSNF